MQFPVPEFRTVKEKRVYSFTNARVIKKEKVTETSYSRRNEIKP
jgi:hypothetical protein